MLYDRQLAEHFALIHPEEPRGDTRPRVQAADVMQVGRVFVERPLFDAPHESDRLNIEPLLGVRRGVLFDGRRRRKRALPRELVGSKMEN